MPVFSISLHVTGINWGPLRAATIGKISSVHMGGKMTSSWSGICNNASSKLSTCWRYNYGIFNNLSRLSKALLKYVWNRLWKIVDVLLALEPDNCHSWVLSTKHDEVLHRDEPLPLSLELQSPECSQSDDIRLHFLKFVLEAVLEAEAIY